MKKKKTAKKKKLPEFRAEDEEHGFWTSADSTDYIDWDNAERVVLPELKPTQKRRPKAMPPSE
jgi:hypothetical protein